MAVTSREAATAAERSSESRTTRIALIGCGFIGTIHSFAIRSVVRGGLTDAAVVAACDQDVERAERMLAPHGEDADGRCPEDTFRSVATDDVDEALAAADVAWICTPTVTHREMIERCVAHMVPVYCEKPLSVDLDGAAAIAASVSDAGLPSQVGLVLRYAAPYAAVAAMCRGEVVVGAPAAGALGPPMAAVLRDDQFFPVGGMYGSQWRAEVSVAGGGTLLEHSIHDVDILTSMFGAVVSVTARTKNHAGNAGIEDVATVIMEHESGVLSTLVSVWHGVASRPSTRRLEVFFEKAHLVLENEDVGPVRVEHEGGTDDGRTEVGLGPDASAVMERLAAPDEIKPLIFTYASSDLAFLTSLAAGRTPQPGIDVALRAHVVVDAAYRSAASGGAPQTIG